MLFALPAGIGLLMLLLAVALISQIDLTRTLLVLVIGVTVLSAYFWLIGTMRRGRNWARIVLTALTAVSVTLWLLEMLFLDAPAEQPDDVLVGGAAVAAEAGGLLFALVPVLLVWLPSANRYFAR
ncbi:hypothetical protein GCM10010452_15540 [Crossiella cryophila]